MKIPSTVRDPRILAQRRAELVEVATNLFLERGYHDTSIRDIARACPFNLATLYTYVSSKQDILYLVAQHLVREIVRALDPDALTNLGAGEALRRAFETYCGVVSRFSRHIRLLYREIESLPKHEREPILRSVEALTRMFERLLERAVASGEVRPVNVRVAALDLLVAAHSWALHARMLREELDLETFTREQSRIVFEGLLGAAARADGATSSPPPDAGGDVPSPGSGARRRRRA